MEPICITSDTSRGMRAAVAHTYGPPTVLSVQQVPLPAIRPDQVLIKVAHAAVNPPDCKQRSGNLKMVMKHKFPLVLGQDFAGTVEAVGSACTRLKVGDEVYGTTGPDGRGTYAELVAAFERETTLKPADLTWPLAAATPTAAATAYRGVIKIGSAKPGNRVLVHGASGSVGSAAAQIAVAMGCSVVGTCSTHNLEYIRSLGVEPHDYSGALDVYPASSFDLIFDAVGGDEHYRRSLPLLKSSGRYVSAVGPVMHGMLHLGASAHALWPRAAGSPLTASASSRMLVRSGG
jgi:NADPH:quinone reductase-like Zn-dependent oxidoreductase